MAAALGLVALAVVVIGWLQNPDHITAVEAVDAAESAFAAAGLRGAVVDPHPAGGVYVAAEGRERVPVWKTSASYGGGSVELWLARADGESVFLDDRAPDGASQLLTDDEFRRLADHYENPAVTRQIHRNALLTVAAALVALLALRLSVAAPQSAGTAAVSRRPLVAAAPSRRALLRRLRPVARATPVPAVAGPRPASRPGRPLRAHQESS